jgi:YebC/PmpR family DNA-binding regulatory protein
MAGHSKFKNIQFRKGAQDKKRAKLFAKISKEITVAAKLGLPDPSANPRLRSAIALGRAQNMPKDNIERAVKKSFDENAENYEEVRYEGFGIEGIGIIVESLTDNRNRTAGDIRSIFSKHGGNLGETGSVSFMFNHLGIIKFSSEAGSFEEIFEIATDAGALDCDIIEDSFEVSCSTGDLHQVAEIIEKNIKTPITAQLSWKPSNQIPIDKEKGLKVLGMIDVLDDHDDVQEVFANFDLHEEIFDEIS